MADFDRFIGIVFEPKGETASGCDCWGLCRLVLRGEFGVVVHDLALDYEDLNRLDGLEASAMAETRRSNHWAPQEFKDMEPGDVLLLRLAGFPIHCGLSIGNNRMLHIFETIAAHHVDIRPGSQWHRRIIGIYRHRELANAPT